jgi:hypothetical protein
MDPDSKRLCNRTGIIHDKLMMCQTQNAEIYIAEKT